MATNFGNNTLQPQKIQNYRQEFITHQSLDQNNYAEQDPYLHNHRRQQILEHENDSSGLGQPIDAHLGINDASLDMKMMIRGSIGNCDDILGGRQNQVDKSSDDLTLDMLGGPSQSTQQRQQNSFKGNYQQEYKNPYGSFAPQITSKNPPSSALNLLENIDQNNSQTNLHQQSNQPNKQYGNSNEALSLEQYRQNNENLQQILMQFNYTPQFNPILPGNKNSGSAPLSLKNPSGGHIQSRTALGSQFAPSSSDILNEVSQFNYIPQNNQYQNNQTQNQYNRPEVDQVALIRDNLSKIELLQNAIDNQQPQQQQLLQPASYNINRRGAQNLQAAGIQILQNENKNQQNQLYVNRNTAPLQNVQNNQAIQSQLKVEKNKSQPIPDQRNLIDQHKQIMLEFDDIPISKIKNMVGYQTNVEMYSSDAKLPASEDDLTSSQPVALFPQKDSAQTNKNDNFSDDSDDEGGNLSLDERLRARQWKVRMRAAKEINQMFNDDYAKSQSDPNHVMQSFDQYGPLLQEMIKDTNLTNAYESLNCLYSYVRFSNDIRQVTFSCHIYLLEKVQTNKPNFREITLKIILCMLRRLQGPSNTILPELLKRFKSKNPNCAIFCLQVILQSFKMKEQSVIQELNLKQLFKSIQSQLTHKNNEIRESAYQLLKHICERCKDEASLIVQNCDNLRPVQIKELTDELTKIQKMQGVNLVLFDDNGPSNDDSNFVERENKVSKQKVFGENNKLESEQQVLSVIPEQEVFDLLTLVPDDFVEIPYMQAINPKKKAMEIFNSELQKIVDKGQNASIKQKDYSVLTNIIFHMLEEKNMLVFLEAIKSVELLAVLQQLKSAAKLKPYILLLAGKYGETKTAVIAATDKAMAAIVRHCMTPVSFSEIVINQIATSHKNPRVKQFLITNPITQMIQTIGKNDSNSVVSVFKTINKAIIQLILKDNNDAVRNAAVLLVIDFGLLLQSNESFTPQIQSLIQQLPKSRINEINKKLQNDKNGDDPVELTDDNQKMSKTLVPPKKSVNMSETPQTEDEFSKTLVPANQQIVQQPSQFYQTIMKQIKTLPLSKLNASSVKQEISEGLQNLEIGRFLLSKRSLLTSALCEIITNQSKSLVQKKDQVIVYVELLKELLMMDAVNLKGVFIGQDLIDFLQISLLLTELGVEQEAGVTSQLLVLAMEVSGDLLQFLETLRQVIELPQIMQTTQAIKIISNVYFWLGLKLHDFMRMGLQYSDIEELRGFGIKYLESTSLYSEKQRQQLITVMLRFKDQIQELRTENLQTLGQTVLPSSRSHTSSVLDVRQQTAQFNREPTPPVQVKKPITAQLIVQTIDNEFEEGLLMFKELAQSSQGLDFETKELIFNKLLGIVAESFSQSQSNNKNLQQQQYRQAYALKALMWMKEETMGLEDTFKLTSPILSVYLMQVNREIDASVELYLLNFWVRELTIRDLCDRIQATVSNIKSSRNSSRSNQQARQMTEEQLDSFRILFLWLCEQKLEPQPSEWKLGDLRKIALLIVESILNNKTKAKDVCRNFLRQCVERDGSEKVLEFMEIQLMHSNEVFLLFLDWFQQQYPKKQQDQVLTKKVVPVVEINKIQQKQFDQKQIEEITLATDRSQSNDLLSQSQQQQPLSYMERRQQMKTSNLKQTKKEIQQSELQVRNIINKIENEVEQSQNYYQQSSSVLSKQNHENLPQHNQMANSKGMEPRRSRYDESRSIHNENQYFDSIENQEFDDEILPVEEIKQVQEIARVTSANKKRQNEDRSLLEKVQQSEAKQRDWVQKIIELEAEKRRIEEETNLLKMQSNQESNAWQQKLASVQNEHQQVIRNLSDVNQSYLQQVEENDKLKTQLQNMQRQHEDMMNRFEQIERKINSRDEQSRISQAASTKIQPSTPTRSENKQPREHIMNSVAKLKRISDTFCISDQQIGIHKICELLLSVERNVDGELAQPLIAHYCKMRTLDERLSMISAIGESLSINEDVLLALSVDVYKALLNFLLRAFAHEKERLDSQSLGARQEQNQVTLESQKLVSRLLNSKDFTTSLVCLFQLLREALPTDLEPELPIEEGQYLRVLMRCINRITKALQTESSDLIRGFDVLLEMQKIFIICPPENLREDLPSLADFDFVFRGMKDVSDKLIDLQPEKVQSFLTFCEGQKQGPDNAFTKYLRMKSSSR